MANVRPESAALSGPLTMPSASVIALPQLPSGDLPPVLPDIMASGCSKVPSVDKSVLTT
jgi:hypothetical protein